MRARRRPTRGTAWVLFGLLALIAVAAVAIDSDEATPTGEGDLAGAAAAEQSKRAQGRRGRRGPKGPPGPRGKRGRRGPQGAQGATGPKGQPGSNNERLYNLNVDWVGANDAAGNDTAGRLIPGVGTLTVTCPTSDPTNYPGDRKLTLSNQSGGKRVVAQLTSFLDDSLGGENVVNQRQENPPGTISFGLPQNGMITGNISVEPISGSGVLAGSLTNASIVLSSYYQTNDTGNPANNWCHVSAQVAVKGAP